MRLEDPEQGAHAEITAQEAVDLFRRLTPPGDTGGVEPEARLVYYSEDDPAVIDAEGKASPMFQRVLAWVVTQENLPLGEANPPGRFLFIVDATSGEFLTAYTYGSR